MYSNREYITPYCSIDRFLQASRLEGMTKISDFVTNDRETIFRQLKELVSFNSVHNEPGLELSLIHI